MGNLAEHHYMVSVIAWQLASSVNSVGAKLDIAKVFEFASIHDIGELFGGDISMPYAKANPKAREYAKKFEAENHSYIAKFFGDQSDHFKRLSAEILDAESDEAHIVKIADYIEVTHYKFFIGRFVQSDIELISEKMDKMISGMKDKIARKELTAFVKEWKKEMSGLTNYPDTIHRIIS